MVELQKGDFVYQSDQELFLIVLGQDEDSYLFAAHGWRNIGKERIDKYLEDPQSKVHHQSDVERLIEESADEEQSMQYEKLQELFESYKDAEIADDGPEQEFALDEE